MIDGGMNGRQIIKLKAFTRSGADSFMKENPIRIRRGCLKTRVMSQGIRSCEVTDDDLEYY
jgi:hypothetical protein